MSCSIVCFVALCFVYDDLLFSVVHWFFRDNEQLSKYGDTKSARGIMLAELKKLIEANPLFRDKLQFPTLKNSRLRTLINQRYLRSSFLRALILDTFFLCFEITRPDFSTFVTLHLQLKLAAPAL